MKYAHTMIRVLDLDKSIEFYSKLGLRELRRYESPMGRFTLVFMGDRAGAVEIELTYNWGRKEAYTVGDNFGHLAFMVENIHDTCEQMMAEGVPIVQPPRDGYMAFIKSPDNVLIELLQNGKPLRAKSPWTEMPNLEVG